MVVRSDRHHWGDQPADLDEGDSVLGRIQKDTIVKNLMIHKSLIRFFSLRASLDPGYGQVEVYGYSHP
jgi:hypothetical protein